MKAKLKTYFDTNPNITINAKALGKRLKIKKKDYDYFKSELHSLFREGYLQKTGKRYKLNKAGNTKYIGELQLSKEQNYGFVILGNSKLKDIFISEKHLNTAFDGDKVEVALFAKRKGKNYEGQIINVVERKRKEIIGILRKSNSFYFVEPDDSNIHRDIYISSKNLKNAKDGDKVVVSKIKWVEPQLNPEGSIIEVLGRAGSYDTEIASIAREFGIRYKFPKSVIHAAKNLSGKIGRNEIQDRVDYRGKNVFTIDPQTAKDYDDAVSVEKLENGNL